MATMLPRHDRFVTRRTFTKVTLNRRIHDMQESRNRNARSLVAVAQWGTKRIASTVSGACNDQPQGEYS